MIRKPIGFIATGSHYCEDGYQKFFHYDKYNSDYAFIRADGSIDSWDHKQIAGATMSDGTMDNGRWVLVYTDPILPTLLKEAEDLLEELSSFELVDGGVYLTRGGGEALLCSTGDTHFRSRKGWSYSQTKDTNGCHSLFGPEQPHKDDIVKRIT